MKILKIYKPIAGSMSDFINQFQNNEQLYAQARSFWQQLEAHSFALPIIILVLGIGFAAFYYKPYNDMPHRHYKPLHWLLFLVVTFVVTFLVTWGYEYVSVPPRLQGANWLEVKIAIANALYTSGCYFLTSVVWCYFCPTNAYRFFKF